MSITNNLETYNKLREVPKEAQKTITGGRLNGKTDINPMWRIKALTETFGMCGIGWRYEITRQWIETGANDEVAAFTNINLYVKVDDKWSEAIPGTGGSAFVAKEKYGMYTSDECYKMSLTDAISVACKALGVGADIYWDADKTKYDKTQNGSADEADKTLPNADSGQTQKIDKTKEAEVFGVYQRLKNTDKTNMNKTHWENTLAYFANTKYESEVKAMYQKATVS